MRSKFIKFISGVKKVFIVLFVVLAATTFLFKDINELHNKTKTSTLEADQRRTIHENIKVGLASNSKIRRLSTVLYKSMVCISIGEGCSNNPDDYKKDYQNSIVAKGVQLFSIPFSRPASGVYWAKTTLEDSGLIPKSYASEGIGFSNIKAYINLWKIIRNFCYLLLVIILIITGFLIMFRAKVNPQTIISVENSLPKITLALILITFSFPIAGFLIDFMYVVMAIGISILSGNDTYFDTTAVQNQYMTGSPWLIQQSFFGYSEFFGAKYKDPSGISFLFTMGNAVLGILGPVISVPLRLLVGGLSGLWVIPKMFETNLKEIVEALNNVDAFTFSLGMLPSAIISPVALLVVIIIGFFIGIFLLPQLILGILIWFTIMYLFFRIWFILIAAYIQIILLILLGPFYILLGVLPGSKIDFSQWLKNLLGELSAFPVVVFIFLIGNIITQTISEGNAWSPPFMGGIDPSAFSIFIGLGIMFIIPDLIKTAKDALGAKSSGLNIGFGTFFGGAGAAVGGGMSLVGQYGSIAMAFPQLRGWLASKSLLSWMGDKPAIPTGSQPEPAKHK